MKKCSSEMHQFELVDPVHYVHMYVQSQQYYELLLKYSISPYIIKFIIGAKYLVFFSSRSVKLRELSFVQFVDFLGKVCLFFNF
jgi:hypothetical protein